MSGRERFFPLYRGMKGRQARKSQGGMMLPTEEELSDLKEALELVKAEYRACADPRLCDKLDLVIQGIERKIAGENCTLRQLRAIWDLMDEACDDQPVNALRFAFGSGAVRIQGQHRCAGVRYPGPHHSGAGKRGSRAGHDARRAGSFLPVVPSLRDRAIVVMIWESVNMLDVSSQERRGDGPLPDRSFCTGSKPERRQWILPRFMW